MKKTILCLILSWICLVLCSCDPGSHNIDTNALSNVVGIELIEYKNDQQKHFVSWVPDQSDQLLNFDFSKMTILEVLPEEKIPDFISSFEKTDILHEYFAYDSPKDICIRLNYSNGDFLIIWANYAEGRFAGYIGEYHADGTVSSFWGSFSDLYYYEDLVEQYFTHTLE